MEKYSRERTSFEVKKNDFKLKEPNKFGNYDQFTDENGLQEYRSNFIINHMTGEEIHRIQVDNLQEAINALVASGEWRYPAIKELDFLPFPKNY